MKRYIAKRLLYLIPVLFLITLVSFFLMHLSPGDPALIYLSQGGSSPSEEALSQLQEQLGLNKPLWEQYASWLWGVLHGDLGTSISRGTAVTAELAQTFPATLRLTLLALLLTLLISIPLGILAAVRQNTVWDMLIRFCSFVTGSMPGFFVAVLLIYLLAVRLRLLPSISSGSSKGIIIPALTLAITLSPTYIRQIRTAVIQELGQEYIRMLRARGLRQHQILLGGVLRSVGPFLLTLIGIHIGQLLGGTAIIEMVCTYQGLGRLAVNAVTSRDYPLVQGYVLVMALIYVLVNLLVDLLHVWLDPRVREQLVLEEKGDMRI